MCKGYKLIEQAKNFFWDYEAFKENAIKNIDFYNEICDLKDNWIADMKKIENTKERLHFVFSKTFHYIALQNFSFSQFLIYPIHDIAYDACLFSTLCMYLHMTNRIKGKSLNTFIYENSLYHYNDIQSPYYCPRELCYDILSQKGNALRKFRHRRLSSRPVYNIRPQWSPMSKDSEFEWILYNILVDTIPNDSQELLEKYNLSTTDYKSIKNTLKRISNLYNDINNVQKEYAKGIYDSITAYHDDLLNAYKKFTSKIEKLKYEDYLKLQKFILSYLNKNDSYKGINIYRLEKQLKPYTTIKEVRYLLEATTEEEKCEVIKKSFLLKDIFFPRFYDYCFILQDHNAINSLVKHFFTLQNLVVPVTCLIIDTLIESAYLGENWEELLLTSINEMVENVFYDTTQEIDISTTSESESAFKNLFITYIQNFLHCTTGINFS